MDAVLEAVSQDFDLWVETNKHNDPHSSEYTADMRKKDIKVFLQENFGIDPKYNISMDDIALAYSSPEPDRLKNIFKIVLFTQLFRSVTMNTFTETLIACTEELTESCPSGTKEFQGSCYEAGSTDMDWEKALLSCEAKGPEWTLAGIHNRYLK